MSAPGDGPAQASRTAPASAGGGSRLGRAALTGLRYGLPALATVAGIVIMALGGESNLEGGASIVSAGLAIYFVNWLYRIGARGDRERDAEDAAREYFSRHGRWPK
jgi:hypothetical protein